MKLIGIRILAFALIVYFELGLASLVYLTGMGRPHLFQFPFLQWFDGVRWWHYSADVRLWVCLGLAVPAVITILLGVMAVRRWWSKRKSQQELYGRSEWMTPREATEQGGKLKPRPF